MVAWAGMRGVVSLAAAFGVPMTTLSGDAVPGPAAARVPDVRRGGRHAAAARADAAVGDPRSSVSGRRGPQPTRSPRRPHRTRPRGPRPTGSTSCVAEAAGRLRRPTSARPRCCATGTSAGATRRGSGWAAARRRSARAPTAAFRRLRLEMLAAERETFIAERDAGPHRRRGAAVGAARTRPRGGDAQPGSSVRVRIAECAHRVDQRGEGAVRGGEIGVGHVAPSACRVCSANGVKKPSGDLHPVIGDAQDHLSPVGRDRTRGADDPDAIIRSTR